MTKAEWARRDRAKNLELGLCRCGRKRRARMRMCARCNAYETKRRDKVRTGGLCYWCRKRKAKAGTLTCPPCRKKVNRERREAMALYRAVYKGRP